MKQKINVAFKQGEWQYRAPELEIIACDNLDVLTASLEPQKWDNTWSGININGNFGQ